MRNYLLALFLLLSSLVCAEDAPHKIVYLISPPRSLSVGFLRMIEARGDFKIYHEPSLTVYHQVNHLTFSRDWFREDGFQSFEEIKQKIFSEESNVFVKEMSFHLKELIDDDLISRPNVYFVFLFRNPHHTIISLYNKIQAIVDDFQEAVGYEAAYDIYQKIASQNVRPPLILFSEELASQPEKTVKLFCSYVGIPFKGESLCWKDLGQSFNGHDEWHENKRTDLTQHWHGDAIRSTGFAPLKSYEIDSHGNPTFVEIADLEDRKACQKAYLHSLPYYLFFEANRS
jgi:Sulfotransferase domain